MRRIRHRLWLSCFALHFVLILGVCCHDLLSVISRGYTVIPSSPEGKWAQAEAMAAAALGRSLPPEHPVRSFFSTYMHFAGIEASYSYFAPNIPDSYKLIFELHFEDGRILHDVPVFENAESTLRLATLMDQIGSLKSNAIREIVIKLWASSVWQRYPDAVLIRAILGSLSLPSAADYEAGKRPSYRFLYAYDFRVTQTETAPGP